MLGFIRGGLEDFSISRAHAGGWGIPFPIAENGETAQREDGTWDPEAGTIYVWYDALINYITGAGFPDDPDAFARWWPADLHVIGKDIARFHTIYWPAMLWSAGLEAPRQVWVHGWLLAAGRRADEQEPWQLPRPRRDGRGVRPRRRPLRDLARGSVRPRRRRQLGLVRPALQRRPRQRLREPREPDGVDGRPLPGRRPPGAAGGSRDPRWARPGPRSLPDYGERLEGCRLHEALALLWEFVGAANKTSMSEQPWVLAKAAAGGDDAAGERLRDVLGDLVEACRLVALAAAPFMPGVAPRVLAQLGHAYPYRADGNGGPPLLDELRWGAHATEVGHADGARPAVPAARGGAGQRPCRA